MLSGMSPSFLGGPGSALGVLLWVVGQVRARACCCALSWWSRTQALGGHLDGVPGRAERWGVGQVEVVEGVDGHVVVDGGGGDVDPFGDLAAALADQLGAEQPAGAGVAG